MLFPAFVISKFYMYSEGSSKYDVTKGSICLIFSIDPCWEDDVELNKKLTQKFIVKMSNSRKSVTMIMIYKGSIVEVTYPIVHVSIYLKKLS